jgi:hypothetical protein
MSRTTNRSTDATNDELYLAVYEVVDHSGWSSRYVDQVRATDEREARQSAEDLMAQTPAESCELVDLVKKRE